MEQPLVDIQVLEIGGTVSVSAAGKKFSDFGANVVKIEPPSISEIRKIAPFPNDLFHIDHGAMHLAFDTSKKSLVLDHNTNSGKEIIRRLASQFDLIIIDLPALETAAIIAALNFDDSLMPNIVTITPHGMTGPYKDRIENDLSIFGWSTRSHRHSITGNPPLRYGPYAGVVQIGSTAAAVGIAAVWGKKADGIPRNVDIAGVEALMGNVDSAFFLWSVNGALQPRSSGQSRGLYPMGAYKCKDGYMLFSAGRDPMFTKLCNAIGRPEVAQDQRFIDPEQRPNHFEEFKLILESWLADKNKYEAFNELQEKGVMACPVLDASELQNDPQSVFRNSYITQEKKGVGDITLAGPPFRMNGLNSESWVSRSSPNFGEHTNEILKNLKYSDQEIIALFRAGVTS
ncbi:MAG: CoA transferase [Dehalococcoidia bacterium]|nr:MAG: Crotonobetainyl-CoA:carnitine CoA-transferase CaiB [Chloroflexota bacterium]